MRTTKSIKIPFEEGDLSLLLPGGWKVVDTVCPVPHPKLTHLEGWLVDALDHPIGSTVPLRERGLREKRIVLCVDDISHPTPTASYFGALLDYLIAHGAMPDKMRILFGLGVHRDMTAAEARVKLGPVNLRGIHWWNHCRAHSIISKAS